MMNTPRPILSLRLLVTLILLAAAAPFPSRACDTPVYRYALENWLPDVYPMVLFHKGPLTPELQEMADDLETRSDEGQLNVGYLNLDVDKTSGTVSSQIRKIQEKYGSGDLPRLVLFPPQTADGSAADALWDGPPDPETVKQILDSPARREIAKRLIEQKHAAVWVLLESADPKANNDTAKLLTTQLAKAPAALAEAGLLAPELEGDGLSPVETTSQTAGLTFSVLRIASADPQERFFTRMLLLLAPPEVRETAKLDAPVAIPVFGRGRALGALPAAQMNNDTILEGCAVLAGPCACEIKEQNPGVDMLFAADWMLAFAGEETTPTEIPSLASVAPLASVTVTTAPADATTRTHETTAIAPTPPAAVEDVQSEARNGQWLLLASGAGTLIALVVLTGILGYLIQRRSRIKS